MLPRRGIRMKKGTNPMKANSTGELRIRKVDAELIRKLKMQAVSCGITFNDMLISALNYYAHDYELK
jgi:predicted HicB family RNase H-like nuclease